MVSGLALAAAFVVTTVAGVPATPGFHDGAAHEATFNRPTWIDVVSDAEVSQAVQGGDIFVIDRVNQSIRRIHAGAVTSFPVRTTPYPGAVPVPFDFGGPFGGGITIEPPGSGCGGSEYDNAMFIASSGADQVLPVAFVGSLANRDGIWLLGMNHVAGAKDGSPGLLNTPTGIALSTSYAYVDVPDRQLWIADSGNDTIRRVRFQYSAEGCPQPYEIETLASGFHHPLGLAAAPDDSVYVADSGSHTIRRVAPDGSVTIVAGEAGVAGSNDGLALQAHLDTPTGIDFDTDGNLIIADSANHTIRMLTRDGMLVTIAGAPGVAGYADGAGTEARFNGPVGVRVTSSGTIVVADTSNDVIRLLTPAGSRRHVARH